MKPIKGRAFGSIPHLFHSCSNGDKFVGSGQHRIATEKARDIHDLVIVQEKVDGANVAVLKKDGELLPVSRNGHMCLGSTYEQHRIFDRWVRQHSSKFDFLLEGERLCGEWMILAHGTKYDIKTPLIVFDIIKDGMNPDRKDGYRLSYKAFTERLPTCFTVPKLLSIGGPCPIEYAMSFLGKFGHHGGLEEVEGAVWRVERAEKIDFLAKYLRKSPETIGRYLGKETEEIWNVDIDKFKAELPWTVI
jgi:hypothetical protein